MKAQDLQSILAYAPTLDGVFTMSDLKVLFGKQSEAALYKKIAEGKGGSYHNYSIVQKYTHKTK